MKKDKNKFVSHPPMLYQIPEYDWGGAVRWGTTGLTAGATIGSAVSPVGTVIGAAAGALIGGGIGYFADDSDTEAKKASRVAQKAAAANAWGNNRSRNISMNDNGQAYMYGPTISAYGGRLPVGGMVPAELEKNEVVQYPNGQTDQVNLPTHEQADQMQNPPNEGMYPQGSFVYSDRLKIPGTKKTYADEAAKYDRRLKRYEKLAEKNPDAIRERSLGLMSARAQEGLKSLAETQEAHKAIQGIESEVNEFKKGGWIKDAVNPKHRGYCTPMTKATCTPRRKALAMTFKKHHGFHKAMGGYVMDLPQYEFANGGGVTGLLSNPKVTNNFIQTTKGVMGSKSSGVDYGNLVGGITSGIESAISNYGQVQENKNQEREYMQQANAYLNAASNSYNHNNMLYSQGIMPKNYAKNGGCIMCHGGRMASGGGIGDPPIATMPYLGYGAIPYTQQFIPSGYGKTLYDHQRRVVKADNTQLPPDVAIAQNRWVTNLPPKSQPIQPDVDEGYWSRWWGGKYSNPEDVDEFQRNWYGYDISQGAVPDNQISLRGYQNVNEPNERIRRLYMRPQEKTFSENATVIVPRLDDATGNKLIPNEGNRYYPPSVDFGENQDIPYKMPPASKILDLGDEPYLKMGSPSDYETKSATTETKKKGWGTVGNVINELGKVSPVLYNMWRSGVKPDMVNPNYFMDTKPIEPIVQSADEQIRMARNIASNITRNPNISPAERVAALTSLAQQSAQIRENVDNVNRQSYENAQVQNMNRKQQNAQTALGIQNLNMQSLANKWNFMGTGVSQLSQYLQGRELMGNQKIRDIQFVQAMAKAMPDYQAVYENGTLVWKWKGAGVQPDITKEQAEKLINGK